MPCTLCYSLSTGLIDGGVVNSYIPDTQLPPDGYAFRKFTDEQLAAMGITDPVNQLSGSVKALDLSQDPHVLIDYTPPVDYAGIALAELWASDKTLLRCFERNIAVPSAWVLYRDRLREIANGTQKGPLPTRPDYPAGT